ncbi:hypothetical protein TNCV_4963731 [Trichonephila clavipes]|nr:hypothetical protein TNCV_4963731 [Trichonephila clavipes]
MDPGRYPSADFGDQSEKLIVFRKRILSRIQRAINQCGNIRAAQNKKGSNQIASEERSGLSSAQTENPILSALADRLQEINLRVGRLQEASAVTARKSGGNYFNRRENVFKCFYCGIQGHRQAECRISIIDQDFDTSESDSDYRGGLVAA